MKDEKRLKQVLQMLDRAYNGPLFPQEKWDSEIIPSKAANCLAAHGLNRTCDRKNPVNTDDALADAFYQAGIDLALETGVYCIDTERVIHVTQEELADTIASQPASIVLGTGKDQVSRCVHHHHLFEGSGHRAF
jgi:methylamine--corrinoid protein Co-methyltransferase